MARTALLRRLTWQPATISDITSETPTAVTLRLAVDDWPGHRAGQHIDIRLTASDGYTAIRPYSLASPGGSQHIDITVALTPGGEVSGYLTRAARVGHHLEVRGPLGNWFVWDVTSHAPVQLVGAGSGVVPLVSMLRTHASTAHQAPMRLLYSLASPEQLLYPEEMHRYADNGTTSLVYTRIAPPGERRPPARITMQDLHGYTMPASARPDCFVCGPTGFVETVITLLVGLGHTPDRIRAERYGERSSDA